MSAYDRVLKCSVQASPAMDGARRVPVRRGKVRGKAKGNVPPRRPPPVRQLTLRELPPFHSVPLSEQPRLFLRKVALCCAECANGDVALGVVGMVGNAGAGVDVGANICAGGGHGRQHG